MDRFLLMLLLLGAFLLVLFQAEATMCMVCSSFKRGHCLKGKGNCTVNSGRGCRTQNFFTFSQRGGWLHNYTELDCANVCMAHHMYYGDLKVSTYCCHGQDFCNKYQGLV